MKKTIFVLFASLFSFSAIFAQVSPTPVINNEIRDISSVRRRSMELERVQKEANQVNYEESSKEQKIKFAQIKDDFENIQKLELQIIQTYTTGKKINYQKISESATEISKRAARLNTNLFLPKTEQDQKAPNEIKAKNVRDLIVDLDNKIGDFINSPIFKNNNLVDSKASEKAQGDLENIIKISDLMAQKAKNFK
ncbi:MAG: hypothetical protein K1X72_14775 [Pyrinomonadaceae bacterium]|nr:hypothetical protein [Pyrinomonadaceae bacterium]